MALATRRMFPQDEYGKRGPYVLSFCIVFALLLSLYTVVLSPLLIGAVLIGWVIGLLSPVLSLLLLLVPLMFLSGLFSQAPSSIPVMLVLACIAIVLAVMPILVLIWLKRWLDPEPGSVPAPGAPPLP